MCVWVCICWGSSEGREKLKHQPKYTHTHTATQTHTKIYTESSPERQHQHVGFAVSWVGRGKCLGWGSEDGRECCLSTAYVFMLR